MQNSEKLKRTFVREEAYLLLRDWIIKGKLLPNQKLRDKDLAEQLGVSRTPIREALLQLEREGFVHTKPNCSTLVCPIDLGSALSLYSIVWTLENLALKQSFDSITPLHLDLMIQANERLLQALKSNESALAVESDNDFHSIYIQLSKNDELCQILAAIKQKLMRLEMHYFGQAPDVVPSYQEHLLIIEAMQQKDLSRAQQAVELNWKASLTRLQCK